MKYLILNRIISFYDIAEKESDIIFFKKYKIFINKYYITI